MTRKLLTIVPWTRSHRDGAHQARTAERPACGRRDLASHGGTR